MDPLPVQPASATSVAGEPPVRRVLIVEDENTTRAVLTRVLQARGWVVTECADAETGWAEFSVGSYPLILLNWMLPGMSGLDLCRKVRTDPRGEDAVVLVITGRSEAGALHRVLEAGADDYLAKPIDIPRLNVRLQIAEKRVRDVAHKVESDREQRRLEQRMLQAEKFESLGILAGNIAHDFNNMLVGVLGYTHLAMMDAGEDKQVLEHLGRIESASSRASELTNQLLTYSGRGSVKKETLDLNEVAPEMAALVEISAAGGAVMEYDQTERPLPVYADVTRLRQVVLNLVKNAADAIGEASGTIRISTGLMDIDDHHRGSEWVPEEPDPGHYAFIQVEDDGCGMDETTRGRMFDPCFTTKDDGFGLGLAAAIGVIRSHGGAARVRSAPSEGTAIRVVLPLGDRNQEAPLQPTFLSLGPGDWRGTGKVLVVDDEENVRGVATMLLERIGFEVITASSEAQGLARLKDPDEFAVVMLDMSVAEAGGIEGVRRIRQISNVPVVVCSGSDGAEVIAEFAESGAPVVFLRKPFRPRELADCMRTSLEGTPVG